MHGIRRYALYHLPDGALGALGAAWLGWDAVGGTIPPRPDIAGLPVPADEVTAAPRRYGFHGTLKPPFGLADGAQPHDLADAARTLAARLPEVACDGLAVGRIGPFLALVPTGDAAALGSLAARLTADLDDFRAPPEATETARRRAAGLSDRQEAMLLRWGYPYVMEEFRFHLTLTGRLDPAHLPGVEAALAGAFAPVLPRPFRVRDVALMGEDERGFFHLIERLPLGG